MAVLNGAMFGVMDGSDSEEEETNVLHLPRVTSTNLSDADLNKCTRLSRELFNYILVQLGPRLQKNTDRCRALTADTQLLIACTFFASGGFQWLVGRTGHVSQSSCSRIIHCVVDALLEVLAPHFITLPTTEAERTSVKQGFYDVAGMPNTLAAVDGTHVYIRRPTVNPNAYINRRGRHTINVQIACDSTLRIVDVVANYPGSNHDSYIWANSSAREMFSSGRIPDGWWIGDRGYPCEPWLMTEVENPQTVAEEHYNASLRTTRCCIERCIGVLKTLFSCIDLKGGTLLYTPVKVCRIFVAVCVLHNLRLEYRLDLPDVNNEVLQDEVANQANIANAQQNANGHNTRAHLINQHF